jgi:hypothetical protein
MPETRPSHPAARRAATRSVVAVAFVVAVGGTGAASAYWSETGGGTGSGATGASTALVLTPGTVAASLHPGGRGDVVAEARNPGAAEVVLGALELDTSQGSQGVAVDPGHPGCPATAFTVATRDDDGASWAVPGRSGGVDGSRRLMLPGAVRLATDAPNDCQGATVTVFLRVA